MRSCKILLQNCWERAIPVLIFIVQEVGIQHKQSLWHQQITSIIAIDVKQNTYKTKYHFKRPMWQFLSIYTDFVPWIVKPTAFNSLPRHSGAYLYLCQPRGVRRSTAGVDVCHHGRMTTISIQDQTMPLVGFYALAYASWGSEFPLKVYCSHSCHICN